MAGRRHQVDGPTEQAEGRRLLAVADYAELDPAHHAGLAVGVHMVAHFLDVPMAAIGLIEQGSIRFASGVGVDIAELPRGWALTPRLLAEGETIAVADTSRSRRFSQHPLGGVGPVRAWAATPMRTPSGLVIGAIFAADRRPRPFTPNQLAVLEGISELLMAELELRKQRHRSGLGNVLGVVERQFDSLLRDASDTVAVLDADGGLAYCSPALQRVLGYTTDAIIEGTRLIHPDDMAVLVGSVTVALVRPGITGPVEFRLAHGDGTWRTFEAVLSNNLEDPAVAGVVVYLRDVTYRHRQASLLAAEARVLELIARETPLSQVLYAVIELLEGHSPGGRAVVRTYEPRRNALQIAAAPNLPASFTGVIGNWPLDTAAGSFAPSGTRPLVIEDVAEGLKLDPSYRAAALSHRIRSVWSLAVLSSASRRLLGTVGLYMTERRIPDAEDEHLLHVAAGLVGLALERHQAGADSAVPPGLMPRPELIRRVDSALARNLQTGGKVGVLLLDLDRFKEINEAFGHEGGDMVLPVVTQRVSQVVRPSDLVARVAGDEFVVVCEGLVGELEAVGVAERIQRNLGEPIAIDHSELRLSASIGIAMTHGPGDHAEALLRDADAALYQAKQRGRARFELFNDARRREAQARRVLESELERALDKGELRVWLQPEFELPGGALLGYEALVRWEHPERGLLAPAEFVPHAERSGLIDRLGTWVLEEACRVAQRWLAARESGAGSGNGSVAAAFSQCEAVTTGPMVSVNLSVRQLSDPLLPNRVAAALEGSGLSAGELCLELTESALMDDADLSLAVLRELKKLGVRLAIDDFGTGYSSLAYLRRFPIDAVKIDRSFVSGLGSRSEDGAIVTAVLGLTRALGLMAIAEGVEEEGQRDELVRLGCGAAQGYLFARPRPADEVVDIR
jgi:diguanylate cyclase (GGDEF)-like protein/PAS domain S-box-containing protein